MKKILAIILTFSACVSLSGCGTKTEYTVDELGPLYAEAENLFNSQDTKSLSTYNDCAKAADLPLDREITLSGKLNKLLGTSSVFRIASDDGLYFIRCADERFWGDVSEHVQPEMMFAADGIDITVAGRFSSQDEKSYSMFICSSIDFGNIDITYQNNVSEMLSLVDEYGYNDYVISGHVSQIFTAEYFKNYISENHFYGSFYDESLLFGDSVACLSGLDDSAYLFFSYDSESMLLEVGDQISVQGTVQKLADLQTNSGTQTLALIYNVDEYYKHE